MDTDRLNEILGNVIELDSLLTALAPFEGDPLVGAISISLRATPLGLYAWFLPLSEVPETSDPWGVSGEDEVARRQRMAVLDKAVDDLTNPAVVARVAEVLWWSGDVEPSYQRLARRALDAHDRLISSLSTPTARLLSCWSGAEIARRIDHADELMAFRRRAIDHALELVTATYRPGEASRRMQDGLHYLYGILCRWEPLSAAREVTTLATLATVAAYELPVEVQANSMTLDVVERLLFVAAGSDAERVRVVKERCDRRRLSSRLWLERFNDATWGTGELSYAIEDASEVATKVNPKSRTVLERLADDLVVELQDLGWRHGVLREAMVSPEDVTHDAQEARTAWRSGWRDDVTDLGAAIREIGSAPSPLEEPPGLLDAAFVLRPSLGSSRGRIRVMGFIARDTLGRQDLDECALAEVSRHRLQVWGEVVADRLEDLAADIGPDSGLFSGPLVSDQVAERFAEGLRLFLAGNPDAAAHVSVPRLEAVIRERAVSMHLPALQAAYRGLGRIGYLAYLLAAIKDASGPNETSTWTYLERLLVDANSAGLRNVLSHGLRESLGMQEAVSRSEAALVIHAAALLAGLPRPSDAEPHATSLRRRQKAESTDKDLDP